MKINITLVAFVLSLSNLSAVTTVNVSNLDTVNTADRAIVDNSGAVIALGAGAIQVGYFDSLVSALDFGGANKTQLLTDFQAFSATTQSFANTFGVPGFFSAQFEDAIGDTDAIVGKTLYTVIGNGATLAASDDFIVFSHDGELFAQEVAGVGGNSGLVKPTDGTLLLGSDNGNITVSSTLVGSYKMAVVPVPEPSSTVLLGLGGVALFLRRRR